MDSSAEAKLPEALRPRAVRELIRLGRDNDGGYLVDLASVQSSDFLLSFGIRDDWSFEKQFRQHAACPVVAFDPTVSYEIFLKGFLRSLPYWHRPSLISNRYRPFADYRKFFRGDVRHIRTFVGLDGAPGFASLTTIFKEYVPETADAVFLKVDIEGWEYRILDEIVHCSDRLSGLAIEFHDADLHLGRIVSFVEKFPLSVCHVHANNYDPLSNSGLPITVEVSFSRHPEVGGISGDLPHRLDMPNKVGVGDYRIEFRESSFFDRDQTTVPGKMPG